MKLKSYLLVPLLAAAAAAVHAQNDFVPTAIPTTGQQADQVKYTLLKPDDKTFENVKEGEHNPFGKSDKEIQAADEKGTNEENQIRDILTKLPPVGRSPGVQGDLRVMLGDLLLVEGKNVPNVLPQQTVTLRVGRITSEAIELIWVEKKPSGLPARTLNIPIDLRPSVRVKLPGKPTEKQGDKKDTAPDSPIAKTFPEVAQTAAAWPVQMAKNTTAPRAIPVAEPVAPARTPAASKKASAKPDPEWEEAIILLDRFLPKENPQP